MKKGLWAVGLVCAAAAAAASTARAGFMFNYTAAPGSGSLSGMNVFNFYALNDQTGPQAGSHSLLAMSVTYATAGQPFKFDFRDSDGDGLADANVYGNGFDETNATGTYLRFGSYADWLAFVPKDNTFSTKAGAANPVANYANVTSFKVEGFSQNKTLDATQGFGRYFGTAVVPAGVDVTVSGKVAAELGGVATGSAPMDIEAWPGFPTPDPAAAIQQGPDFPFSFTATAPEPATFGLLGVAGIAALRRRRR